MKTGKHQYEEQSVAVTCQLAKSKLNINQMFDYASLLTNGRVIHHMLHVDGLVPNQDWEPPQHLIPKVWINGVGLVDPKVSANARRSSLSFHKHVRPASTSEPAKEVVTFYQNTGIYRLF